MIMLENFVRSQNAWNEIFGKPAVTFPLTQTDVDELAKDIDSQLSPENLMQDGEITVGQAQARRQYLDTVAAELEQYAQNAGFDIPVFYN